MTDVWTFGPVPIIVEDPETGALILVKDATDGIVSRDRSGTDVVSTGLQQGGLDVTTVNGGADGYLTFTAADKGPLFVNFGDGPMPVESAEAEQDTNDTSSSATPFIPLATIDAAGDMLVGVGPDQVGRVGHPGATGYYWGPTSDTEVGWIPGPTTSGGGSGSASLAGATSWDAYGAKADGRFVTASTTSGSAVATVVAVPPLNPAPVASGGDVGKLLSIPGAAGTSGHLVKIGAISGTSVTMHVVGTSTPSAASATVTNVPDAIVGTDNTAAMDSCLAAVSTAGGGYIFGQGRYMRNRCLQLLSGCHIRGGAISGRYAGNPHSIYKTVIAPGNAHGAAANLSTPATSYEHWDVADFSRGDTVLVGTGGTSSRGRTGGITASGIKAGDVVFVRSTAASVTSGVEVPYRLTPVRVRRRTGETLELDDVLPWDVTGAKIFVVNPSDTAVTGGPLAAPTWVVQDASVEDVELDGYHPVWGGCAYNLQMRRIRPRTSASWNETITLNSMVHAVFEDWAGGDWTYTSIEIKFGSRHVLVKNVGGTWRSGGSTYTPVSIGESSTDVTITENTFVIPAAFSDATKVACDIRDCSEPKIIKNKWILDAANIDAAIAVAPNTNALRVVRGLEIVDNEFICAGGVGRTIKVGPATTGAGRIQGAKITGNTVTGTLKPTVNEWLLLAQADDVVVRDNWVDGVVTGSVGPAQANFQQVTGRYEQAQHRGYNGSGGFVAVPQTFVGYMDLSDSTTAATVDFGDLPNRSYVTECLIDVLTQVAGVTGTISVGHSATSSAAVFVSAHPVTSAGRTKYTGGAPNPTGAGTNGSVLGGQITGFSSTSRRSARITFSGTLPTDRSGVAGKFRVLLTVLPGAPDK